MAIQNDDRYPILTKLISDVNEILENLTSGNPDINLTNYYKKEETYNKTEIDNSLLNKVDIVSGKGLSTNDLTASLLANLISAYNHSNTSHVSNSDIGTLSNLSTTNKADLVQAINEVFQNVSNGKVLVASAITDKGIPTLALDTFITMANNIRSIQTGTTTIPVTSVSLNQSTLTLTAGNTSTLTATVLPTDATNKNVTWTSSDTTVATVNNGVVTGVKAGTCTITVTTLDGSKTATCSLTVNAAIVSVTNVSLNKAATTITNGNTEQLTATIYPTDATNKNVTWSSSNTSIATVSSTGLVTSKGVGFCTITVTTVDGNKSATCSITVSESISLVSDGLDFYINSNDLGTTANIIKDLSGKNRTINMNNFIDKTLVSGGLKFNGTNQYLSSSYAPVTANTSNFTVEYYGDIDVPASGYGFNLIALGSASPTRYEINSSGGNIREKGWTQGSASVNFTSAYSGQTLTKAHVVARFSVNDVNRKCELYINNVLVGTTTGGSSNTNAAMLKIGTGYDITNFSPLNLYQFRVYTKALTDAEITQNYYYCKSGITGGGSGGSGSVTPDLTSTSIYGLNRSYTCLNAGETETLTLENTETGSWLTTDNTIVTVDSNGLITGVNKGTANIYFKSLGGVNIYKCQVTVLANKTMISGNSNNIIDYGAISGTTSTTAVKNAITGVTETKDTVYIPNGVFKIKNVNISSVSNFTVLGQSSSSILMNDDSSVVWNYGLQFTSCNNITFENITFDGNKDVVAGNDQQGVANMYLVNCTNVTFKNCTFQNNWFGNIILKNCNYVTLNKCTFLNSDVGIMTSIASSHIYVYNSYFDGASKSEPISIFGVSSGIGWHYDVIASGNTIKNHTAGSGIGIRACDGFVVEYNNTYNCASGLHLSRVVYNSVNYDCLNGVVKNNVFDSSRNEGIVLTDAMQCNGTVTIKDNVVKNSGTWNVSFNTASGLILDGNTITNPLNYNVQLFSGSSSNQIINNTFNTTTKSIHVFNQGTSNTITGNIALDGKTIT